MHTLILGDCTSGKSYIGKKLAAEFMRTGRKVFVLNPIGDKWPADFQTWDPAEFLDYCRSPQHQDGAIFIDEAGDAFAEGKLTWLATRGRHFGHACFFIGQRYTLVPKTVRALCSTLYLFASHPDDCIELAGDFNDEGLRDAYKQQRGHFLFKKKFHPLRRGVINFAAGTVDIGKEGDQHDRAFFENRGQPHQQRESDDGEHRARPGGNVRHRRRDAR